MFKTFTLMLLLLSAMATSASAQQEQAVTQANIENDLKSFVCKNDERLEAAKSLFKNAGVAESDVSIVSTGQVHNLVIVKKGESDESIVVGAHYDKVSAGCGVIDNWTGIVIIANLYKYLLHFKSKKTFVFIAFDREEEGLVGSNAFASAIPKEKRSQ